MLALVWGCNLLLDVDHIEFADTTTATTSPGTGGTGGAGGTDTGEDCTDATDDDGDGLIDCQDDDCASFECIDAPPEGWTGPVAFWIGEAGSSVPTCPDGWSMQLAVFDGMVAPPATCAACNCSPATGGACGMPSTQVFDTQNCSGQANAVLQPSAPLTCSAFTTVTGPSSAEGGISSVLDQGSCTASGGAARIVEVAWQSVGVLCQNTAGDGCASGICAHPVEEPMTACITTARDIACPRGYSTRYVVHGGANDERGCTACTCGSASGGSCAGGTTAIYSGGSCSGTPLAIVSNNGSSCTSFSVAQTQNSFLYQGDAVPSGGGCSPGGGEPTGAATQTGALTVCCP